jgi:hypothetical protein
LNSHSLFLFSRAFLEREYEVSLTALSEYLVFPDDECRGDPYLDGFFLMHGGRYHHNASRY